MHNNLKKREKEQERVRNFECPLTAWVPFGYQMKFFVDTEVNCQKKKNTSDIDSAVFCVMVRVLLKDYKVRMHTEDLCAA